MGLWFRRNVESGHLVVLGVAFSLLFSALLLPSRDAEAQGEDTLVLRFGTTDNVTTLNPFLGLTDIERTFTGLVYDCLQAVDENLNPVPNLALSWWKVPITDPGMVASGEPYGSVWEYNLTTNASWSDGVPFTPADVVFTIDLNCAPSNFSDLWAYQPYTYYISHAEIVDADTVRIHFFDRSTGDALPVAFGDQLYMPIMPKHKLEPYTASFIGFSWTGLFAGDMPIVGTGPFMATPQIADEIALGENLTLMTNPNYHWADDYALSIRFDELSLRFYPDEVALDQALRAGDIDVAKYPAGSIYLDIEQDASAGDAPYVVTYDGLKCTQEFTKVAINMDAAAGSNPSRCDPAVRVALAMATDKDYIAEELLLGLAEPGSTLVSPVNDIWHLDLSPMEEIRYDLASADSTLEAAGYRYPYIGAEFRVATADSLAVQQGWVAENTVLQFEVMVRDDRLEEQAIADHLEAEWATVGVDLVPDVVSKDNLSASLYGHMYDLALWYSRSDPDPHHILFTQSTAAWGTWSDNLYYNSSYEANYEDSISALNHGQRMTLVEDCQMTFYQDVGSIILAYPYQTYAWRTDAFDGWGEWNHPGRSLDACWGANPLFFDLVPAELNSPPINLVLSAEPEIAFPGDVVTFNAAAADVDMEPLIFTLEFGDGAVAVNSSKEGSWEPQHVFFTHTYTENGTFDLVLWADDGSGIEGHNVSKTFPAKVLIGDLLPPVSDAELEGTPGLNGWYVSNVTVTLTVYDNMSSVASTKYRVNSDDWLNYSSSFVVSVQGQVTVQYYSVDSLGNAEQPRFAAFKIDVDAPVVTPDYDSGHVFTSSDIQIQWVCEENVSGYDRSEYSLDGSAFVPAVSTALASDPSALASFDGLPDGEHTLVIRAYDDAGNVAEVTLEFEVETVSHNWLAYVGFGSLAALAVLFVATLIIRKRAK